MLNSARRQGGRHRPLDSGRKTFLLKDAFRLPVSWVPYERVRVIERLSMVSRSLDLRQYLCKSNGKRVLTTRGTAASSANLVVQSVCSARLWMKNDHCCTYHCPSWHVCQDTHRRARQDLICLFETRILNSWSTRAFIKSTSFSRRQCTISDDLPPPMSARRVDGWGIPVSNDAAIGRGID